MNQYILKTAEKLIKKFDTRDPFEIAEALNITIFYRDLGDLKGFYKKFGHNRYIVINENLDETTKRIVCAHELGHDQLHKKQSEFQFHQDSMLFYTTTKYEYEANVFAAELLLSDENVLELFQNDYDFFQATKMLEIDRYLLAIKVEVMNNKGHTTNCLLARGNEFLRRKSIENMKG